MKYIGTYKNNADVATKQNVDTKQNKITANGVLKGDGEGNVSSVDTQECTLIDIPDISVKQDKIDVTGILKGTGDGNVEVAVPGTDYLAESDIYICTVTASGTSYTADKTPTELLAASNAGKLVVAMLNNAVYFFAGGNVQVVRFARVQGVNAYALQVTAAGTAALATIKLQESALITDLESNKTSDTTYPSSKAVWDATPHPDTKTDEQTQPVSMDSNGKLWTAPSSDIDVFTGASASAAGSTGIVPAPAAGQQSKYLRGDGAWADLPNAGTGSRGVTYLVDSYTRTDTDKAVTPKALNSVYKLIPTEVSQLTNDSNYITNAALSGYAKTTDIPTNNNQLTNGAGYITGDDVPVQSVNGETGNIVLAASDVGAATTGNIQTYLNRTTAVDESNTSYTSYMARGEALFGYETTPSFNGTIAWQYE